MVASTAFRCHFLHLYGYLFACCCCLGWPPLHYFNDYYAQCFINNACLASNRFSEPAKADDWIQRFNANQVDNDPAMGGPQSKRPRANNRARSGLQHDGFGHHSLVSVLDHRDPERITWHAFIFNGQIGTFMILHLFDYRPGGDGRRR